jgi:sugar phosphate isomerase/epimerase
VPGKLALNMITVKQAGLAQGMRIAAEAGYDGVGLWIEDLHAGAQHGLPPAEVARSLNNLGIACAEVLPVMGWMYADHDQRDRAFDRAEQAMKVARLVGCDTIIACAAMEDGELADAVTDFRDLCHLARRYDVRVALEFLGGAAQINDVASAWHVIDGANQYNGGLLLDTFHFYQGRSSLEDLAEVVPEKIFLVHINDCIDLPIEELSDLARIMPGLGAEPLTDIVALLVEKGYDGYYSLEVFNEEYWESDPRQVAADGLHALRRALEV